MDQREKNGDFQELLRVVQEGVQLNMQTCCPATILDYDETDFTVTARPLQMAASLQQDGTTTWIQLPVMAKCPIQFPRLGGFSFIGKPKINSTGLAVFSQRSMDEWWLTGQANQRGDLRDHHYTDAFIIPGITSQPEALTAISDNLQIRNDAGTTFLEFDDEAGIIKINPAVSLDFELTAVASIASITQSIPILVKGVPMWLKASLTP